MTATTWRPLAAVLLCGAIAGWTAQGWRKDACIAALQRAAAIQTSNAATALAQATARVLTLERAAGAALAQRADHLTQEQIHAKTERDRFNDDVRSGAVRLSIPVAAASAPPLQIPPLPQAIGLKRAPNLTQRLRQLLTPLPATATTPPAS